MDVREDAGLRPNDYKLKLNSYDLGVDIELADALQRLRFEHPEVHAVVLTSLKPRIFCAGANIFMLGTSGHGFKVNFCKFTNETRLGMEDMSANSGIKFLAAINGICAGGGYELALACDEILPGRRWQRVGVAARDAAARRAARHRRADARGRQAQGASRRRRPLQHADRRRARQARGGLALRGQGVADQPVQGRRGERGRASWRRAPIGRRPAPASCSARSHRRSTATRIALQVRQRRDRPRQARRAS